MPFGPVTFIGTHYIIDDAPINGAYELETTEFTPATENYQLEFFAYQAPMRTLNVQFANPTIFKQRVFNTNNKMRNEQYWKYHNPALGEPHIGPAIGHIAGLATVEFK